MTQDSTTQFTSHFTLFTLSIPPIPRSTSTPCQGVAQAMAHTGREKHLDAATVASAGAEIGRVTGDRDSFLRLCKGISSGSSSSIGAVESELKSDARSRQKSSSEVEAAIGNLKARLAELEAEAESLRIKQVQAQIRRTKRAPYIRRKSFAYRVYSSKSRLAQTRRVLDDGVDELLSLSRTITDAFSGASGRSSERIQPSFIITPQEPMQQQDQQDPQQDQHTAAEQGGICPHVQGFTSYGCCPCCPLCHGCCPCCLGHE